MNEELAAEVVKEIGGGKTKFFEANVLETESISAAVTGALAWIKETGKEVGGVILHKRVVHFLEPREKDHRSRGLGSRHVISC